jgi:hypothetical protein
MTLRVEAVNFDCHEPERVARFWGTALGREPKSEDDYWYLDPGETGPEMIFISVPEGKDVKNRIHVDLRPDDQAAEVERLIGLGAKHAQIGQTGEESWIVLADVEGNEFCILRAKPLVE